MTNCIATAPRTRRGVYNTKVNQTMAIQSFDLINGTLPLKDWERIVRIIYDDITTREELLMSQNAGDREWEEIRSDEAIARDIETFILPINE